MELTGIRKEVFIDRYALKDDNGKVIEKTPEEMWQRVATAIAKTEPKKGWEKEFYSLMEDFKFVPGGRILSGAGTGTQVTFYNCFVIPSPHDSRGGILKTLETMVEIMARGGGAGLNISSLRPRGSRVKKVNGTSSGPVNWAQLFSTATHDVIQQGGSRRGALMLMLWDWHPDIAEFVEVKKDLTRITGANLSVCISDSFMEAVKNDKDWQFQFPDLSDPHYDKEWNGDLQSWIDKGYKVNKDFPKIKARELWEKICSAAWSSAEPGLVFMERANKLSNSYYFEKVNAVNPCGEQPLPDWGVCNLGSLNLSVYVKNDEFLFKELEKDVSLAVRFLDDVIDATEYFLPENKEVQMRERRIGLGTMGLADTLIKLKMRYGSKESLDFIEKIYKKICYAAYDASIELAKEKGSFPKFEANKFLKSGFVKTLPEEIRKKIKKYSMRNVALLTQAPTGSTSLMTGVSSGIEPVFEFEFKRTDRLGEHIIRHSLYESWLQENPDKKRPEYFVSANDLTPEDHIKVQANIQQYVDASISKTVNAPNKHTVEDVKKLYMQAYDMGCKGVTYMRDGSRTGVLERLEGAKIAEKMAAPIPYDVKPRGEKLEGATYLYETPVGRAYITLNHNGHNDPMEVFVNVGKAGSDVTAMAEALGRIISLILRIASPLDTWERAREIAEELKGIGGSKSMGFGNKRVRSLPDAVAKAINEHFHLDKKPENLSDPVTHAHTSSFDLCPKCGEATFAFEEGCKKCYGCGYSEC